MANQNEAYDFSLFEPSRKEQEQQRPAPSKQPKKKNNLIRISEEQLEKSRRIKYKPTTVIGGIEGMVPMVLVNILGGLISTAVFTIVILIFDWRIGLIVTAGILLYLCAVSAMGKKSVAIVENTQKSQTALIEAVLETIQGMSVIKSFNLMGKGEKS